MVTTGRSLRAVIQALLVVVATAPLNAGDAGAVQLTATWDDNTGGTATTRLERRLETETVFVALADVAPGVTVYVDRSVNPGTSYCYRAFAHDGDAVSPYSDEACATAPYDSYASVNVEKTGSGSGRVASSPAGIDCGTTCSATYPPGTPVALSATPAAGAVFTGWSGGGCSGTDPCTVASNTEVSVTATFSTISYTLSVAKSGPGTVSSTPAGIACGSDCSEPYVHGSLVTLTATPNGKASFAGWSGGGCSGTSSTCVVTVTAATSVSAVFRNGKVK